MKKKNQLHHTVRTISKSNQKVVEETETKSIPLTHIQDHSFSWLGTGILVKDGSVKLVWWTQLTIPNKI
jgi:hypothetical protein